MEPTPARLEATERRTIFTRILSFLDRHPKACAAVVALVTVAAVPALLATRVDNALEVWIDHDSPAYHEYQYFLDTFGSEEYILLVYEAPERFDGPFLERLTELLWELEDIAGAGEAQCLSRVYSRFFSMRGLDAFHEEISNSPFYRNFLISADGRLAAIWLALDHAQGDDRFAVVAAVQEAIERAPLGRTVHLAGSPVLNAALDTSSQRAAQTLFPPVFLLSAIVLLFLYRHAYGVFIPFLSVGIGIAWTLALVTATGHAINMVTVTLPSVVWVLGLSTSIHLLSRCRQLLRRGLPLAEAIPETLRQLLRPCLLSTVTTALGFASLVASTMQPVREMGMFTALGVGFCLATNFLLFPTLARLGMRAETRNGTIADSKPPPHPVLDLLARFSRRRPRTILIAASVLAVMLVAAIFRLRVEANVIEFFKDDAPIAVTYKQLMPRFTGPYSLEIMLTPGAQTTELATLRRIDRLAQRIGERPQAARVVSIVDLIKKAHQYVAQTPPSEYRLPPDEEALAEAWTQVDEQLAAERRSFLAADDRSARLSVLALPMGSGQHAELVAAIEEDLKDLPADWQPRLTGVVRLLVELQSALLTSQIRSFGLAFLIIAPVMALLLRSLRYGLISLLPNLLPVAFALGTMGILGVALDPATVMIAGIALGIAVDDAIHFLVHYRRMRHAGMGLEAAIFDTFHTVGRPMVLTSIVASLGFFVLTLSDFVPLLHFGVLTGVTLGAALVADLLVLPALLMICDRRGEAAAND